jgi:bifunctional non-homologous end joining protein LigD
MQVYCGISVEDADAPSVYAKRLAQDLTRETPQQVTAKMAKAERPGRIFIDWSQNNPHKTTICPYSLRGRDQPTVATPVTWQEVQSCTVPDDLIFTADDVLDRVAIHGDLMGDMPPRSHTASDGARPLTRRIHQFAAGGAFGE